MNIDKGREFEREGKESKGGRMLRKKQVKENVQERERETERQNKYFTLFVSHTTDTHREKRRNIETESNLQTDSWRKNVYAHTSTNIFRNIDK